MFWDAMRYSQLCRLPTRIATVICSIIRYTLDSAFRVMSKLFSPETAMRESPPGGRAFAGHACTRCSE